MGSITITATADDHVIEQVREYAARHNTSLNALASDWLEKLSTTKPARSGDFDDIFALMDKAGGNSRGWKWNREDCYDPKRIGIL